MKKKNLITTVASVAMVGVIAVGSTLAYLSANDGTLTNTFTFANDIVVDVYENTDETSYVSKTGANESGVVGSGVDVDGGIAYSNLIPGQELSKKVDLDVDTTFETYLYVNIKAEGEATNVMKINDVTRDWTAVQVDENGYGIYRKANNVSENTDAINVFNTVIVPDVEGSTSGQSIKNIVIDVWAAQASAFENSGAADAAATEYFNPAP